MSSLMETSTMLIGDNTIPGVPMRPELIVAMEEVFQICKDIGLDFYPTAVELLTYDEISEVASYGGFPVRYPHWRWGMEYEELSQGYKYGQYKIYEMVINSNPCELYCLESNSHLDHVTVIAHATAHNDFFKNNIYFEPSRQDVEKFGINVNAVNTMATHRQRIKRYMGEWGREKVSRFIDQILSIETLIDPADAWARREMPDVTIRQKREFFHPKRINVPKGQEYMDEWINTPEILAKAKEEAKVKEIENAIGIFRKPTANIFKYLIDNAPIEKWEQDVASILYDEAMYFSPQGQTKVANEGWASFIDSLVMARMGLAKNGDIFEYGIHKAGVLGGKYSTNPYKLGYSLLLDIEDRYNKGRFGQAYDDCKDMEKKKNWDLKTGKGMEKVFEVRKYYNDINMIHEFFDQEFSDKYKFFKYKKMPNGDVVIDSKDANVIKKDLISKRLNRGLPIIHLADPNHKDKDIMLLEHQWDGRTIYESYAMDTLKSINILWKNPVWLVTKDKNGKDLIYKAEEGRVAISEGA